MLLGAFIDDHSCQNILDIGTGTGVLALMARQKNPSAKVTAIDIDEQSLLDCKINFENSPWATDLECFQQDFTNFDPPTKFDCIVCNPPYYENGMLSLSHSSNLAKHTTEFSLETLFQKVRSLLQPHGSFWLILPYSTAEKWCDFAQSTGLFTSRKITILGKTNSPKRMILKMQLLHYELTEDLFVIRNADNSYTDAYRELTKEFHDREL